MLSKYGNCTSLLKIKNQLKPFIFKCQIKSGRILHILWAFVPLAPVGYEMIVANSALRASLANLPSRSQRAVVE